MVSVKTGLELLLLGGAVALFFGLGGASGIGQRIGGGFRAFGESVVGGITGAATQAATETVQQAGQQIISPVQQGARDIGSKVQETFNLLIPQPQSDPLRLIPQIVPVFREGALTITTGIQRFFEDGVQRERVFASTLGRVAATPERVTVRGRGGRLSIVTPATAERLEERGFTII